MEQILSENWVGEGMSIFIYLWYNKVSILAKNAENSVYVCSIDSSLALEFFLLHIVGLKKKTTWYLLANINMKRLLQSWQPLSVLRVCFIDPK